MKGRKHTPEQIIRKLREADRLLGEGKTLTEARWPRASLRHLHRLLGVAGAAK